MTLNCVVVDDSAIQRLSILKLIKSHPNLNLVGEFSNALETKKGLDANQVDLMFLDIEMPDLTGFELVDILNYTPQIIVVTGKTEYAFKAFSYDATDYLHKPITTERFNVAINKALDHHRLKLVNIEEDGEHMIIKSELKKHKVYIKDIKWVQALGDYIKLVTEADSFVILSTMKDFEKELSKYNFLRVHKSYIVNLDKIERYSSRTVEIGNSKIPLSRNQKEHFAEAISLLEN